jgi:hypothetical protein
MMVGTSLCVSDDIAMLPGQEVNTPLDKSRLTWRDDCLILTSQATNSSPAGRPGPRQRARNKNGQEKDTYSDLSRLSLISRATLV